MALARFVVPMELDANAANILVREITNIFQDIDNVREVKSACVRNLSVGIGVRSGTRGARGEMGEDPKKELWNRSYRDC